MAESTDSPGTPAASARDQRRKQLWFLLALPGLLGPVVIFVFILTTERAHDEDRCPYEPVTERTVPGEDGARVREERRRCVDAAEERRYTLIRGGQTQLLGRRRFAPEAFAGPDYHWEASVSETGEVQVVVHNPVQPSVTFREGRPDER